jgi:hypothetical protein
MEDDLQWKVTSNGKRTPMEDKTSNARRPSMKHNIHLKTTSNRRRHPMEDYPKIIKVKYLVNQFLDHTQI